VDLLDDDGEAEQAIDFVEAPVLEREAAALEVAVDDLAPGHHPRQVGVEPAHRPLERRREARPGGAVALRPPGHLPLDVAGAPAVLDGGDRPPERRAEAGPEEAGTDEGHPDAVGLQLEAQPSDSATTPAFETS
jgi:hypothetical protein